MEFSQARFGHNRGKFIEAEVQVLLNAIQCSGTFERMKNKEACRFETKGYL